MDYYFTQEEVNALDRMARDIQTMIGRALGREEAYHARRDEFKLIDFSAELARRNEQKNPPSEPEQRESTVQTEIGFLESIPILEFTPKESNS